MPFNSSINNIIRQKTIKCLREKFPQITEKELEALIDSIFNIVIYVLEELLREDIPKKPEKKVSRYDLI